MTSASATTLETRSLAVATANAHLERAGLPSYSDLYTLLNECARVGLSFSIGNAYIRRSFIDEQTELSDQIDALNAVMPEPGFEPVKLAPLFDMAAPAPVAPQPVKLPACPPTPVSTAADVAGRLSNPAAALHRRILESMQEYEEMGGSADYAQDMTDIADSAVAWMTPGDRMGTSNLDDIRHWLLVAREVLPAQDCDALHEAVRVDAMERIEVFRANGLESS